MPVVADGCYTCHGSTEGMFAAGSGAELIHANVVDGCENCHAGQIGGIPQTVADAHNGATTERGGIIWDGIDTSVTEGALFNWEITGVVDDGTDLILLDLEDLGLLDHPYTSAGRIPTESGYRTFVKDLMESPSLSVAEKNALRKELDSLAGDTRKFLRESSKLLGRLTNLLGVVLSPRISTGVLDRLEVVVRPSH